MKCSLLVALGTLLAAGLLLAQGSTHPPSSNSWRRFESPYDPKTPPPVQLCEAYALVLTRCSIDTNRFFCQTAGCLQPTKRGLPGWTFCFSNTNGERACVEVSFDKEVDMDTRSRDLLHAK